MSIHINTVYNFKFGTSEGMDSYTSLNGIYKVLDIYSYQRILNEDVDLYTLTFSKVNVSKETFETEIIKYTGDNFYMLQSVLDEDIICIPDSLIIGYPSPDVKEYPKLMLSVDLGVFDAPETVLMLENIIKETIVKTIGAEITDGTEVEPVDPKVSVVVYLKEWMSCSDYVKIRQERKAVLQAQWEGDTSEIGRSLYARYVKTKQELDVCKAALREYHDKMSNLMNTQGTS